MEARHYSQTPPRVQCKTLSIIDTVIDGTFEEHRQQAGSYKFDNAVHQTCHNSTFTQLTG